MNTCNLCYLTGEMSEWKSNYFGCDCMIGGSPLYTCIAIDIIDRSHFTSYIVPLVLLTHSVGKHMEIQDDFQAMVELMKHSIILN